MSEDLPAPIDGCDLCEAARYTHWYFEDDICWIADCEICSTPMVVWKGHGTEPPDVHVDHMMTQLGVAADARFGIGSWKLDRVMRQIPDHFHAHSRDPGWMDRRWTDPMSKYTGVGTTRETR